MDAPALGTGGGVEDFSPWAGLLCPYSSGYNPACPGHLRRGTSENTLGFVSDLVVIALRTTTRHGILTCSVVTKEQWAVLSCLSGCDCESQRGELRKARAG